MTKEPKKLQSAFVRGVMKGASERDIEDATERWYEFLRILHRIASDMEKQKAQESGQEKSNP